VTIQTQAVDFFDLSGRVAIVTGSTRGIGDAIAAALGHAGATIVVSSENALDCERAEARLLGKGIKVIAVPCDISSSADIENLVNTTVSRLGRLDILVCNAGVEGPVGPIGSASSADIDRTIKINLNSAISLTSQAIPHMVRQGCGSVILVSSIAGLRGNRSIGVYGLTKAALAQLARNLAVEWGPQHIRVNCISPGLIETDFSKGIMANDEYFRRRLSLTPLRRVGKPEEIAAAALFLAGNGGAFVTGHNLVVDGGTIISDGN